METNKSDTDLSPTGGMNQKFGFGRVRPAMFDFF
jgi:hypothetical protein